MTEAGQAYVRYRLERAREALDEAAVLWETAHYNAYVNRLYYACFYAVNALLLSGQVSASTHTGVRHLFAQNYIRTGVIEREAADVYFELFHYRQRTDYEDAFRMDPGIARPWLAQAHVFVMTLGQLASSSALSEDASNGSQSL